MDNLTVKDKAKYLIRIFGKEYAIKCVDEIIEELNEIEELVIDEVNLPFKYWQNVKLEINLL
jgi:cell division protein ZapA (FtsZ GTPase activity inhibitor)